MSIAIQEIGRKYNCKKFVENNSVRSASKSCDSLDELEHYLMTLPGASKSEISALILELNISSK